MRNAPWTRLLHRARFGLLTSATLIVAMGASGAPRDQGRAPAPSASASPSAGPPASAPVLAAGEIERRTNTLVGKKNGGPEVQALFRWLGIPAPTDWFDGEIGSATMERKNLDLDPEEEAVVSILVGDFNPTLVLIVLDAAGEGLRAVGHRVCEVPRASCQAVVSPVHHARFADVIIKGEGSTSNGNASVQIFRTAEVVTLERGRLESILQWGDSGRDIAHELEMAAAPRQPPRVFEERDRKRVTRRLRWNPAAFKYK